MKPTRIVCLLAACTADPALAAPQLSNFQMIPMSVHKNLQVLPKNTSKAEVERVMDGFNTQLGVKCDFCHAKDGPEKDEKPHKADARRMMRMVADLNAKKTAYFGPRAKDNLVTCATCHRGKAEPAALVR